MFYKKILNSYRNWIIFFDSNEENICKKNYYSWLLFSNIHIVKKNSYILSPFIKYKSIEDFYSILKKTIFDYKKTQILNKNFNKFKIEKLFPGDRTKDSFFNLYLKMDRDTFNKIIKSKISAFLSEEEFFYFLKNIEFWHNKWTLSQHHFVFQEHKIIENIKYNKDNILIIEIKNFNEAFLIGTHNWCISRKETFYKEHKYIGERLFFIYDFNKKQYEKNSFVGVTFSYGNYLNIKYAYDLENKITNIDEYREKLEEILLGSNITRKEIFNNINELKDDYDKIQGFINNGFEKEAFLSFHNFINDRDNEFRYTFIDIISRKKFHNFIIDYIKTDIITNREKNILIDLLASFFNDSYCYFDYYFLKDFFDALNDNDYSLDMIRKLSQSPHTYPQFKFLFIHILKGKYDREYIFHYCLKTDSIDIIKMILADSCVDSLNLFYLFSLFSSEDFKKLDNIIKNQTKQDPNSVSLKLMARIRYFKIKMLYLLN